MDSSGEIFFECPDLVIKSAKVAPENDGDLAFVNESGPDDIVDVRGAGGGEEKDAEGGQGILRGDFPEAFEARADGKSGDFDFVGRNVAGDQAFVRVFVGDEEIVGGRAGPGRVDFDGVGDDGDDGDAPSVCELAVDHVRVERVGVDDQIGLELVEEVGDGVLGFGDEGEGLGEVLPVRRAVHPSPDDGGVGGDFAVCFAEEGIDAGVAEVAGVGDQNFSLFFDGLGEVAGRAVVPVAKAGREN